MAPLKLYTGGMSYNGSRVELVLAEKGITDVEIVTANFKTGSHKTPDFLSKSTFGQVPLLEDSETGIAIYESRAICRYLANKYADRGPSLVPDVQKDLKAWAKFEEALCVEVTKFDTYATPLAWLLVGAPMVGAPVDASRLAMNTERLKKNLSVIDRILSTQKYMAGDTYTLADVFYIPMMTMFVSTGNGQFIDSHVNIMRWWKEVSEREAWKKVKGPLEEAYSAEGVRRWREER